MGTVLFIALVTIGLASSFGTPLHGWEVVRVWVVFGLMMVLPIVSIIGGVFALRRRRWRWALAGAICACPVLIGVASVILLILSKEEFTNKFP
jgi:hypothetical protein